MNLSTVRSAHLLRSANYLYYQHLRTFGDSNASLSQCHYSTLGVSRTATASEIKSAYNRLAKEHHPDLNREGDCDSSHFVTINEAYSILSDKMKKRQYDLQISSIHRKHTEPSSGGSASEYQSYQQQYGAGNYGDIHNDAFVGGIKYRGHSRYGRAANKDSTNRRFWWFFAALLALSYGSLVITGKHFLNEEWDRPSWDPRPDQQSSPHGNHRNDRRSRRPRQ